MSLISELENLDLSAIIDARAIISGSTSNPDLVALLEQGVGAVGLGGLGTAIQAITENGGGAEGLLGPLTGALTELAGPLRLGDVPVTDLIEATRAGAEIAAQFLGGLDGTPESLLRLTQIDWGERVRQIDSATQNYAHVTLDRISSLRGLFDAADAGFAGDVEALAHNAVSIVLPFPRASLVELRSGLDRILEGAAAIAIPASRSDGLRAALDNVTRAAADSPAALARAIAELERARAQTVASLGQDLLAVEQRINGLGLERLLPELQRAARTLKAGDPGLLEMLDDWKLFLRELRARIETDALDQLEAVIPQGTAFLQMLEDNVRNTIGGFIDRSVEEISEWVRCLLRHLHLRDIRAALHGAFATAAEAIRDAELDRFARQAHELLAELRDKIGDADLGTELQGSLQGAASVIEQAVNAIAGALETIGSAVEDLAVQAADILNRVADLLESFQGLVNQIKAAIENLGLEQATDEVIAKIAELRVKAEEFLSGTTLPEPVRPLVEQLVSELEGIDLEAVLTRPLLEKVGNLQLPPEIRASILGVLDRVTNTVQNLIPTEIVHSIEQELNQALDTLRQFNSARILQEIRGFLSEAAGKLEALDPTPIVEQIRAPFTALLGLLDAAQPERLLAPVLDAYDRALGSMAFPEASAAANASVEFMAQKTDEIGRSVTSPMRQLAGENRLVVREPGAVEPPQPVDAVLGSPRPGDVIRMFGYLPGKLREAIAALGEGPAGEVLRAIDGLSAGLARDLRRVAGVLFDIDRRAQDQLEALLRPLAAAELKARFAIQAQASLSVADRQASLEIVAGAHPLALRGSLTERTTALGDRTRRLAGSAAGSVGAALEAAAELLESCRLSNIDGTLDGLLAFLDPEPIALELDALAVSIFRRLPEIATRFESAIEELIARFTRLTRDFNPLVLAQRYLKVIDVVRQELDVLNPRRLARELNEIHQAIRDAVAAYDPGAFVPDLRALIAEVAGKIRDLDVEALLGDLSFLDTALERLNDAVPAEALSGVGAALSEVSERFAAINLAGIVDAVDALGPRVTEQFNRAVDAIRDEIVALLQSLQYATGSASAGASAGGSVG